MTANLPLVTRTGQAEAVVGCRTCHDPHGNLTQSPALLRCGPGQPAHAVCLQCHSDARPVTWTAHGTISAPGGSAIDACGACHDMHTSRGSAGPALLQAVAIAGDHGDAVASNRLCTGCHAAGGQAPPPRIATHPDVPMANLTQPDARGFLPLFDSQGQVAAAGSIGCGTCHLPHGQVPPGAGGDMLLERMSEESRRAMRLLLRPFVPPNACTTCHGTDGLRRFLYYHDPQRREGPLDRAGSR
jgi:predicted CXXCH cytochrome family protein